MINRYFQNSQTNTTVSESHLLNKEWLLPQFVFMAFGETLFTMTGLAFSFSEVNIIRYTKMKKV